MYLITQEKEKCTGCTACFNICPKDAIEMNEDEEGFKYPVINQSKCVQCDLCKKVCNNQKNFLEVEKKEAYGLKLKNLEERKTSSSGGAFVAVSDVILEKKGIVYGASFDESLNVKHQRATNKAERDKMKKSKYVQSDLSDIYKQVREDLKNKKTVLFSGTPCQVNGLRGFLKNLDTSLLYTCDLICHGVPSPKVYRDYLNEISKCGKERIEAFNFRNKKYGWESCYETYQIKNKEYTNIIFRELFYSDYILRPSCYNCQYTNLNRISDITIGDFWGIDKSIPEFKDKEGVSLIIVNTVKGKELLEKMKHTSEIVKIDIQKALQYNLVSSTEKPKNRELFWKDYSCFQFSDIIRKYVPKKVDRIMNPYRWKVIKICKKIKSILKSKIKIKK